MQTCGTRFWGKRIVLGLIQSIQTEAVFVTISGNEEADERKRGKQLEPAPVTDQEEKGPMIPSPLDQQFHSSVSTVKFIWHLCPAIN